MNALYRTLLSTFLVVLGLATATTARIFVSDPQLPDTVKVDSVRAFPGSHVAVPIRIATDEVLSGIEITIFHPGTDISLDSFSFAGSVVEHIEIKGAVFTDSAMSAYAFPSSEFFIYPVHGLFGEVYVTVSDSAALAPVKLDTITITVELVEHSTWFTDYDLQTFVPQFRSGQVNIQATCCNGTRGNVDVSPDEGVDVADLTFLISYLFINFDTEPSCLEEADLAPPGGDQSVDVSDLTSLITYLFIDPASVLPGCL